METATSSASVQCKELAEIDFIRWGLCHVINRPHMAGGVVLIIACVLKMVALIIGLALMLGMTVQHVQYHLCCAICRLCRKFKFIWKQLSRISFDVRESWFYFKMRLRLNRLKGEDACSAFWLTLSCRYSQLRLAFWEWRHGYCCCWRWVRTLSAFRLIARRNYPSNYFNPDTWRLSSRIRARFQRPIFRRLFRYMHVFVVCCSRRLQRQT